MPLIAICSVLYNCHLFRLTNFAGIISQVSGLCFNFIISMKYNEIAPGIRLKQYVKCYYVYESATNVAFEDTVFPSGCMEIIFNLGTGKWQTATGNSFVTTPAIELWGQIIRPLPIKSIGPHIMLG